MNFPACMHCQQPFDAHVELPSGDRSCPGGSGGTFDVQFVASPEVIDFVKANLDKSPKELADLWIERVLSKEASKP